MCKELVDLGHSVLLVLALFGGIYLAEITNRRK